MGLYNGQTYRPLIEQLEASFLGNVKHNFDPIQFKQQFNNCFLGELEIFLTTILGIKARAPDAFVFRVTFDIHCM